MIAKLFWAFVFTIIYTYAGYPLLLSLLARLRPKPYWPPAKLPSLTLLIAAYNEEKMIARKIENSLALEYPAELLQILVTADGSDDQTPNIVRKYAAQGVELCYNPPRNGKMAAINRAIPQARGEIVVFSDANNMYAPDTLKELVAPFSVSDVGAVSGAKVIIKGDGALGESEGLYWKYESFIKTQETRLNSSTGAVGEILAIRRNLFETPPDYIINDDFYLALRLIKRDYRVVYTAKARSSERVSLSAEDEITRRTRIISGRYQAMSLAYQLLPLHRPVIVWKVISHKFLRPLVPLAMIGAFVTNLLAIIWPSKTTNRNLYQLASPWSWIFFLFQLLFYALGWQGNRISSDSKISKLLYLPTFLINSNLAALKGLFMFLTGRQTTLWQRAKRREDKTNGNNISNEKISLIPKTDNISLSGVKHN